VDAYFFPVILCLPMILALLLMQRSFYAHRYPQLILNLSVGLSVYGVGLFWFVLTREPAGIELKIKMLRYLGQAGAPEP